MSETGPPSAWQHFSKRRRADRDGEDCWPHHPAFPPYDPTKGSWDRGEVTCHCTSTCVCVLLFWGGKRTTKQDIMYQIWVLDWYRYWLSGGGGGGGDFFLRSDLALHTLESAYVHRMFKFRAICPCDVSMVRKTSRANKKKKCATNMKIPVCVVRLEHCPQTTAPENRGTMQFSFTHSYHLLMFNSAICTKKTDHTALQMTSYVHTTSPCCDLRGWLGVKNIVIYLLSTTANPMPMLIPTGIFLIKSGSSFDIGNFCLSISIYFSVV